MNKHGGLDGKRSLAFVVGVLSVFLFSACGKEKPFVFLDFLDEQGNYEMKGGYDLKEIDLASIGIGTPGGVCVYNDNIYVCDISNSCIVKLNKDFVKEDTYGTLGMEEGNFSEPWDITFSGGCFYVLDSGNNSVQKFTSDFQYLETYYLQPLHLENTGNYISIAVEEEGYIYVTTDVADAEDAYIHCWKNGKWNKIGDEIVGYLCAGDENIYFVNTFEFIVEEKKTITQSGENILYILQDGKLKPLAQVCDSYAPTALVYQDNCFYMVSAGYGMVHCFSVQEETFDTLLVLPKACPYMYMDMDEAGNMYISDRENKCFYAAEKQK